MGISFTFVSVFCYLGPTYGYNAIVGAVLVGGVKQLLGMGRTEKFAQIMAAMGSAFFTRRICLLGGGIMAVAAITMVAAAAWLAADRGAPRRRVLAAHLGFAFCFSGAVSVPSDSSTTTTSPTWRDWSSRTMTAIWPPTIRRGCWQCSACWRAARG